MQNKQASKRSVRQPARSSISLAVIATLVSGSAYAIPEYSVGAQTSSYGNQGEVSTTGNKVVQSLNLNDNNVAAENDDTDITIYSEEQSASSSNIATNLIRANAVGNTAGNSIDLSLVRATTGGIENEGAATDGAASHVFSRNSAAIESTVDSADLEIDIYGLRNSAVAITSNVISATTTVNNAVSTVAGTVPVNYVSNAPGSSTIGFQDIEEIAPSTQASGTVVVTTTQQAVGNSTARAVENEIDLDLTSYDGVPMQASPSVTNNTISSSIKGNSARNTADIQSGGAAAFSGSTVVTNQQTHGDGTYGEEGETITSARARTDDASIEVDMYGDNEFSTALQGAMSIKGNSISSAATGNEALGTGVAGNRILIGNDVGIVGSGGGASNTLGFAGGIATATAAGDLVILNSQSNLAAPVVSESIDNYIDAYAEGLAGGSIDISGNSITSVANGNAASSAITVVNTAASGFGATTVIANQQTNDNSAVEARTEFNSIEAEAGTDYAGVTDSAISVTGNRISATAYGNEGAQNLSLSAHTLDTGSQPAVLTGEATPQGTVSAEGSTTITNLQRNVNSAVTAYNVQSAIGLMADAQGFEVDSIVASTLAVSGNTQEAVAVGSGANNTLSLAGTIVGAGAGISSIQINDAASEVTAGVGGAAAAVVAYTDVVDSHLIVTDNLQRAIGYGNSVSNTLNVSAGSISVDRALDVEDGYIPTSSVAYNTGVEVEGNGGFIAPRVAAGYALLNQQATQASVTAQAVTGFSEFGMPAASSVMVEGSLVGSSANNDANALVGAAYGNDASNGMRLDLGNVDAGTASIAGLTNVQTVGGAGFGTAVSATAGGGTVVQTAIEDSLIDSTVSASGNVIQALAYGNRATSNQLNITAGNVVGSFGGINEGLGDLSAGAIQFGDQFVTGAAFAVQNAQSAQGLVSASQLGTFNDEAPVQAADVRVTIGADGFNEFGERTIQASSVHLDSNRSTAAATANSAVNGVTLASTNLSSTTAVQNAQISGASVEAKIGLQGVPATPGTDGTPAGEPVPFTAPVAHNYSGSIVNSTVSNGTDTQSISTEGLTQAQITSLTSSGWVAAGSVLTKTVSLATMSGTAFLGLPGSTVLSGTTPGAAAIPGTPGTPAIPNQGGVVLAIGGSDTTIADSTLSVSKNVTSGSVTGNNATNSLAVSGTNLSNVTGGFGLDGGAAVYSPGNLGSIGQSFVLGDHVVSNTQLVEGPAALTSTVFGSFAIDTADGVRIDNSTLSVSGNSQSASAVANTAANGIVLSGTNVAATSALMSVQGSDAAVNASSVMEVFAPVAASGSSVSLSDNKNTALAVVNDVVNSLSVSGANLGSANLESAYVDEIGVRGSHVVRNMQLATTTVDSNAATTLYNKEQNALGATPGLSDGSASITGNSTVAEASANRASNTLVLNGAANLGATAGLSNAQGSYGPVNATATTSASVSLSSGEQQFAVPLNQGNVTVGGNTTTALARGNTATNALNATSGNGYAIPSATLTGTYSYGDTQATLALQNSQFNAGNISATSVDASHQVALNSYGFASGPATNSNISVSGNTVAAQAFGNSATNSVTVASLNNSSVTNSTPTAAIGSYQTNTGAVSARVSSTTYSIDMNGGAINSALRTSGNQVTATAIGNSSVSAIQAAAR